ncbi:hypothetical protein Fcan01_19175 [Folsomia candida]|uniref:Uncharacterized protein n=1 Tax=Folsomia candida TaxID=158441 RepID=A0A226DPP3_FOLCA|nr:hypothetical protein Fcan01_19175 [Folsomia candida]
MISLMTCLAGYFVFSTLCCVFAFARHFPMSTFFSGVNPNCDIQILRDGEDHIAFSASHDHPTTTVFCPVTQSSFDEMNNNWILRGFSHDHRRIHAPNMSLDSMNVRTGSCKIVLNLILYKNVDIFVLGNATFLQESDDVFKKHFTRTDIFEYSSSIYQLAFFADQKEFEICTLKRWRRLYASDMSCIRVVESPTAQLGRLYANAECWYGMIRYEIGPTNPFDWTETNPLIVENYLMQDIALRVNVTRDFVKPHHGYIGYPNVMRNPVLDALGKDDIIPLTINGEKFLSCYSSRFITFEFYVTPFQLDLWISLFITLFLIVICLKLYMMYADIDDSLLSPWLLVIAALCEETTSVLEKKAFYRLSFGVLAVMAVILTNCYSGIMTNCLIAPYPAVKVDWLEDIVCAEEKVGSFVDIGAWMNKTGINNYWGQVYDKFYHGALNNVTLKNPLESGTCFRLLSHPYLNLHFNQLLKNKFFDYLLETWESLVFSHETRIQLRFEHLLLSPKHSFELGDLSERDPNKTDGELRILVERDVSSCQKVIFLAGTDHIRQEYLYLSGKYYWKEFYVSKDSFGDIINGLLFDGLDKSTVPRNLKATIESGIWWRLEEEIWTRELSRRRKSGGEGGSTDIKFCET